MAVEFVIFPRCRLTFFGAIADLVATNTIFHFVTVGHLSNLASVATFDLIQYVKVRFNGGIIADISQVLVRPLCVGGLFGSTQLFPSPDTMVKGLGDGVLEVMTGENGYSILAKLGFGSIDQSIIDYLET